MTIELLSVLSTFYFPQNKYNKIHGLLNIIRKFPSSEKFALSWKFQKNSSCPNGGQNMKYIPLWFRIKSIIIKGIIISPAAEITSPARRWFDPTAVNRLVTAVGPTFDLGITQMEICRPHAIEPIFGWNFNFLKIQTPTAINDKLLQTILLRVRIDFDNV